MRTKTKQVRVSTVWLQKTKAPRLVDVEIYLRLSARA
jgi:hypothetical protein